MNKTFLLAFAFLTVGFLSFSSFENPLEKLIAGFEKYRNELPQEKIYLYFDRPYYTTGDTIWFKAYLTAGEFHKPSVLSHTIYVELINERGHLVRQLKLHSVNGSAAGNIDLPDSLPSGNYLVRSYTNWMKNGDADYFYYHPVKIWNITVQPVAMTSKPMDVDIQFFPEGGDLVNGILSKVAVKATGSDGSGRSVKGKIVDESGEVTCEFKSNQLGMGVFSVLPQKGENYHAVIENQPEIIRLPPTKESGLVMSVINLSSSADVIVNVQTTDYLSLKTIFILAQTRGIVCYAAQADLAKNFLNIKIPKSKFPDGVAQITITDSNGIPLAERLVFISNGEQLNIKIFADKSIYRPRELVTLQIKASDNNGLPVIADLSLAVCDDTQVFSDENWETIRSYLLLSSELRGPIESPGYYFNLANEDRAEAQDNLLLTQGWRRFSFKKAIEPEWQKPEYKIERGLTIKGRMVDKYDNKPIADGKVSYLAFAPTLDSKIVRTNSTRDFEINDIFYYNHPKAMLQGETKRGRKQIKLIIDNSNFSVVHFPLFHLNGNPSKLEWAMIANSIERKNTNGKTIMLKKITIVRSRIPEINNNSIYGPGSINQRVAGDPALENLVHPLQLIQGRTAGVTVTGQGQNWTVQIRGALSMGSVPPPLIMLNNMFVDIDALNMISVHDIESYTIWKGPDAAVFGSRGSNGAIAFYTKSGGWTAPPVEGVFTINEMGFQIEREFYNPKYDIETTEQKKLDERATLFWAPHIQTDSTGFATISFYNHDILTTVTGTIEGISAKGIAGPPLLSMKSQRNNYLS